MHLSGVELLQPTWFALPTHILAFRIRARVRVPGPSRIGVRPEGTVVDSSARDLTSRCASSHPQGGTHETLG